MDKTHTTKFSLSLIGWGVASIIFTILLIIDPYNKQELNTMLLGANFFVKILAVINASVFGFCGALIGRAIKKSFYTKENFTPFTIFWSCGGPQIVGLVLGSFSGVIVIVNNLGSPIKGNFLSQCLQSGVSDSYCSCSYDKITTKYSSKELLAMNGRPTEDLIKFGQESALACSKE
jgi:hypothetical protein